ncbi:flagellar motor switch protein FliN [Enterovirga rhinocerotis]|uniref:Flagellar motor switch protein FliN n=1 Tax=Enterovirga rhinocerotis TaxID=1339210 RepID=A0A4R7C0U5_9HYPH|nr:flagellar motor switch protein FliN [Enterovirga rhinocerotis]TDR90117.1 flagellar motor switch protein FliN/FliY [Enterovirga rhinocerotis]
MSTDHDLSPPIESDVAFGAGTRAGTGPAGSGASGDLETLYDVPVTISAILGRTRIPIGDLLKIGPGALLELDRKVGEAIDIRVNDRLVARGEVVLVEDRLGVTMTEIVLPSA